jgi:hypothetical protein
MLLRAVLILFFVVPALAADLPFEQTFRVRLYEGLADLPESGRGNKQLADVQVVAGHQFSFGSHERGWSVSGVVSAVDPWPMLTGHVNVLGSQSQFKDAPIVNGVLVPRGASFPRGASYISGIHLFYLRIDASNQALELTAAPYGVHITRDYFPSTEIDTRYQRRP